MIQKVCDFIEQNRMVEKGDRIVVGVSGGADSVCLLYVLKELNRDHNFSLTAVHVNHGIRGKDADQDEIFVSELCSELQIDYHKFYYDVKKIAEEEGLSEEEAGRKVRYQSFLEVCEANKCNKIAIAHNKNDNAETVLFHLFRGSGIKGMTGIDGVRQMKEISEAYTVIRPLLCVERKEIETFLHEKSIPYRTDATNLTCDYSRNKIRNRVLNYAVKEINSGAIAHIAGAATQLREIEDFINENIIASYHELVEQGENCFSLSVEKLRKQHIVIQKGIIRKIMENLAGKLKDLEAQHVDQILSLCDKQVGRLIHLPYGMIAQKEYNDIKFFLETAVEQPDHLSGGQIVPRKVAIPGRLFLQQSHKILETKLINYEKNESIPKNSCTKWFDYDKIENAVEIRTRKEGDYIQINRFGGRKKLKDYFIDKKIPKKERDNQILIADGSHIMWIPGDGERISEKYKVEDTTTKILLMKLIDMEEDNGGR